jgi:hypothetical protein
VNRPHVNPATGFGTAVVIALIEEPDGPKLMVEAMLNMWISRIQSVNPLFRKSNENP